MKVLMVYESMFGNTEQIARAVAAGLAESVDVLVVENREFLRPGLRRSASRR